MYCKTLPFDYKETFSRYTTLLKFIGIDVFNDGGISMNSKLRLFVFNVIFVPFIWGQFSLMLNIKADNFLEGAQIVPLFVMFILDLIKMTTALVKKSEIKAIFLEIGELWPKGLQEDDEKAIIMKSWLRRMGAIVYAFYIYAVVNLALFEVMPLLMTCYNFYTGLGEYKFPFQVPGLLEVNSTVSYVATYMWEVSATVPCQLCLFLPYDLLLVTITSNVSILLRLLQIDLKNAVKTHDDEGRRKKHLSTSDPESFERILRIVKDHQTLLRIAHQLSNIFGLVIFIHVAFSSVEICFFGFLTVVFGGAVETVTNLLTVWNAVITIFLLALSGQLLSDTSSSVAGAAYQSLWYESDTKVKKLVLLIIIRSQRTSYLSALGFSDITLTSFSKIMSTSWTYFSLLVQMYKEN